MKKEQVIKKIKKYCKLYKIKEPDFSNYVSVKECCDRINGTCPFCYKYKGGSGVICSCEITGLDDEFWK